MTTTEEPKMRADAIGDMPSGIVYAYLRGDLGRAYVGQTIREKQRSRRHRLGEDSYVMAELAADGVEPEYIVVAKAVPVDRLDEVERDWMRVYQHLGWTLINRLGPDASWPHVPTEVVRSVGLKAGPKRAASIHERRSVDPEYDTWWRSVCAMGADAVRTRRAADPDFDAYCAERALVGSRKGVEVRQQKRATDPEWARRERDNGRRVGLTYGRSGGLVTSKLRVECLECGKVSTPGGIGMHQKSSGHSGKADVTTNQLPEEE